MRIVVCFLMLVGSGCATQDKSVALGGGMGATSGAAIGGIADPGRNGEYRTRNIILGSAIGGMAGMIAGQQWFKSSEEKKKEAFLKGKAAGSGGEPQPPQLSQPKVESKWIEGRVQGNRYIEGHFEHVILEPARWEAKE